MANITPPKNQSEEDESLMSISETVKELDNIANRIVISDIKQKLDSPEFRAKSTEEKLAIVNAYKASIQNKSQDSPNYVSKLLNSPNQMNHWSVIVINAPEDAFLPSAFRVYTTEKLLTMLQKQQQINDPLSAEAADVKDIFAITKQGINASRIQQQSPDAKKVFVLKVLENGAERTLTQEEEARWQELEEGRTKSGDYHYVNLGVLIITHGFLRKLHDRFKDVQILAFIDKIETICLKYNIHNPRTCLRIEESQLRNLKSAEGVYAQIRSYFFTRINTTTPSPSTITIPDTTPSSPTTATTSNATPPTSSAETTNSDSSELDVSTIAAVNQITSWHSKPQKNTTNIFAVEKLEIPVTINFSNIAGTFDNLWHALRVNIDTALQNMDKLFDLGKQINYNVYTNSFGSYAIRDANFSYLEAVRKKITQIYPKEYSKESFLIPVFFLRFYFKKLSFTGEMGYSSKHGYCVDMAPGERRTVRQKTTETTRKAREETRSILDSSTTSKQNSVTRSLEESKQNSNTTSTQHEDYIDSKVNGEAGYKNPLVSVKVAGDCKWGSSNAVENMIDETTNTVDQTVDSEVTEERGQKDTAFTETTKEEIERTQEGGVDRNFENINTGSTLNIMISEMAQQYHTFNVVTDIRMIFANGSDEPDEFPLSEFNTKIGQYIKPNHEAIANIRARILENAKINDYRNRPVQVLDEKTFRFIRDDYYTLLQRSKVDVNNTKDIAFKQYYQNILGVVVKQQSYVKEAGGTVSFPMISPGLALDKFQIPIQQAIVEKQQASALKDMAEAQITEQKKEFIAQIVSSEKGTLAERADAILKVTGTGREILDQAFLGKTLSDLDIKAKNGKPWKI